MSASLIRFSSVDRQQQRSEALRRQVDGLAAKRIAGNVETLLVRHPRLATMVDDLVDMLAAQANKEEE